MESAALTLVTPDVLIDRLVADVQHAAQSEKPGDLLGTEIGAKQTFDEPPIVWAEVTLSPVPGASSVCLFLGTFKAVGAIEPRSVAPDLTRDRAAMAAHEACDLGIRELGHLSEQRDEGISLFGGDLVITQSDTFLPEDFVSVPDRPFFARVLVALTS